MAQSNVIIRLSLKDQNTVRRGLEALGADGERALKRIDAASRTPSAGLKALSAASDELKGSLDFRLGTPRVAAFIRELAGDHAAVLLANHGPVVSGDSLETAAYATEELEETARLFLSLYDKPVRLLDEEQIEELRNVSAPLGERRFRCCDSPLICP